nr:thioesterase domain-containing protein [Rhizobium sp. L1K21]
MEDYLHSHIPLSAAMAIHVDDISSESVRLTAPLAPNINHRETVFGGSASAICILSAWSLLHLSLKAQGLESRVVIQSNTMDYSRPVTSQFSARSFFEEPAAWPRFIAILKRHGRARIALGAVLEADGEAAGRLHGEFVALRGA